MIFLLFSLCLTSVSSSQCPLDCIFAMYTPGCDLDCNIKACYYDNYECYDCALGCVTSMIGDGTCNVECFTYECKYDGNDCFNGCSDQCSASMIGDGNCDEDCFNEACQFDDHDCDDECSPGCYPYMIGDFMCEPECMTAACGYDLQDCEVNLWVSQGNSGDGSQLEPFGTVQEALLAVGDYQVVNITIEAGTYYFNESIFLNIQAVVFLQGCAGVEFRYLSPNISINFTNLVEVSISNVDFDGSELWVPGCDDDFCRFMQIWACGLDTCHNSFGQEYNETLVLDLSLWDNCYFDHLLQIFVFDSVSLGVIKNITVKNTDFFGNLVSSVSSSLSVTEVLVYHSVMYGQIVSATHPEKMQNFYSNGLVSGVIMNYPAYTIEISNIQLYDINRVNRPNSSPCLISSNPGIANITGINNVFISDIDIQYLNNYNTSNNILSFIFLNCSTNYTIQNLHASSLYLNGGSLVYIEIIPSYFSMGKVINTLQNLTIEDSYFTAEVLRVNMSSFINDRLVIANITARSMSFIKGGIAYISRNSVTRTTTEPCQSIALQTVDFSAPPLHFESELVCLSSILASDIQLKGALLELKYSESVGLTGLNFTDISFLKPEFYIAEAYEYFGQTVPNDTTEYPPANLVVTGFSACIVLSQVKVSDSVLDGDAISFLNLFGEHHAQDLWIDSSTAVSFLYLFNNENTYCYISDIYATSSNFVNASVNIYNSYYSEFSGIFAEDLNSTVLYSVSQNIYISECVIQNNISPRSMIILVTENVTSVAYIQNSLFYHNTANLAADIYIDSTLTGNNFCIKIANTVFSMSNGAGPMSLQFSTGSSIGSILFENVRVENIIVKDCKVYLDTGAMAFQLGRGTVQFSDSSFTDNAMPDRTKAYPVVFNDNLSSQAIQFHNCTIARNKNTDFLLHSNMIINQAAQFSEIIYEENEGPLANVYNTDLNISFSQFLNNRPFGSLIGIKEKSSSSISTSSFIGNSPQSINSLIEILLADNSSFCNNSFVSNAYTSAYIVLVQESNLAITGLNTKKNQALSILSGVLTTASLVGVEASEDECLRYSDMKSSTFVIGQSSFTAISTVVHIEDTDLEVTNTGISGADQVVIYGMQSSITVNGLSVSESSGKFTVDSSSLTGSGLVFVNYQGSFLTTSSNVTLDSLSLTNSPGLVIASSRFSASGLLADSCDTSLSLLNSNATIAKSRFLLNQNSAIRSSSSDIYISQSEFQGNQGLLGGGLYLLNSSLVIDNSRFYDNQAFQGGGLFIDSSNFSFTNISTNNNTAAYGNDVAGTPALLAEDPSNNYLLVSGNPISNISIFITDRFNQVISVDNSSYITLIPNSNLTYIQGSPKIIANQGVYQIQELKIFSPPGSPVNLTLISSYDSQISLVLPLFFRDCVQGEIKVQNNSCNACENSTYSLNINDPYCNPCPPTAVCFGTDQIYPAAGFWRDPSYPDSFYACMNPKACTKGSESLSDNCAFSYNGTLCAGCALGYKLQGSYICTKCPDYWVSCTIVAVALLLILAMIAFLMYSNIKSLNKQKSDIALLLKIFVNYCQTVMLFAQIELKWPDSILHLFDFSLMVGDSTNEMMALSCNTIPSYSDSMLVGTTITAVFPFVLAFLAFLVWAWVAMRKRTWRYLRIHFTSTLVVIIFLVNTSICNSLLSLLSCREINGRLYNTKDYSVECFTGSHMTTVVEVVIPGLILWCLVIPGLIMYSMYKNRKDLEEHDIKIRFKTLFSGYTERLYFWEFLIILRKLGIRTIALILISSGVAVQGLGILVVLLFALVLHLQYTPYEKKEINQLELYCIMTLFMYAAGGILFSTEISNFSKEVIGWILFGLNFAFLWYWVKLLFRASYATFKKSSLYGKIKKRFRGNRSIKIRNQPEVMEKSGLNATNKSVNGDMESMIEPEHCHEAILPENPNNSFDICEEIRPKPDAWTVRFQYD